MAVWGGLLKTCTSNIGTRSIFGCEVKLKYRVVMTAWNYVNGP